MENEDLRFWKGPTTKMKYIITKKKKKKNKNWTQEGLGPHLGPSLIAAN